MRLSVSENSMFKCAKGKSSSWSVKNIDDIGVKE
jgi:hypothetical protein